MLISSFNAGVTGLQAAEAQIDAAAEKTFSATVPSDRITLSGGDGLVEATTQRMTGELAFRASLKTLQTAQQMTDTLLELLVRR